MTDSPRLIEIDSGTTVRAATFATNGKYLASGGRGGVGVWRADSGNRMARIQARNVQCLAISQDGRWIAWGTKEGVVVRDARTCKTNVLTSSSVHALDFSPDATRLVVGTLDGNASIRDVDAHCQLVQRLRHEDCQVVAAKYSPHGDRIATATLGFVHVWNSNDGRSLVNIPAKVTPWYNTGLLWSDDQLFAVSDSKIKQFDAVTGSFVSGWPAPDPSEHSCIALPKHGEVIAYSTDSTVTFWDTSTHTQLGLIQHPQKIFCIAFAPDDRSLVVGGDGTKIAIMSLSSIFDSIPFSCLHPILWEPDIQVDSAALDSWEHNRLENAEALLTAAIHKPRGSSHFTLAGRALVRTRLRRWDAALVDAKMAIKAQPSVIGYIAKSVALVGNGKKHKGYRACDIALEHRHSCNVSFLLLIKAIIVFMAGEHHDAISRVSDLINTVHHNSICYVVQAYMYLLLGNSYMEIDDYNAAIQLFEHARALVRHHMSRSLSVVSLITGWKFDGLGITIRQRLCESLYSAGRLKDASESLLELVNAFDRDIYMDGTIVKWVSDFTHQYLSSSHGGGDAVSSTGELNETAMPTATSLLKQWAKAALMKGEWKNALFASASFVLPRIKVYQIACERLEAIDHIADAVECFHQMMSELRGVVYASRLTIEWAREFTQRHLSAPESDDTTRDIDVSTLHVTLIPLLREWVNAELTCRSWEDALATAASFTLPRTTIYQVVCERLEAIDCIADAVECFNQMMSELGGEINLCGEHLNWTRGFKQCSSRKLEHLGDAAVDTQLHNMAITHYTTALLLNLPSPQGILIKRGKAQLAIGSWQQALDDANQVITLEPSSPWGYEMKHAALHKAEDYENAIIAFEAMLSRMVGSADPDVQRLYHQYISPSSTQVVIRKIVQRTVRHLPRVLINTTTGRLHDRAEQASAFVSMPIFNELVSSMTRYIDFARIKREVRQYFQYVMLSHKWEDNEPLFQHVIHIAVYDLDQSLTHDKLQMFCKIVRDAKFDWAWSDTCCIDKSDHFVLQEALVAMFKWYQGSALMIVFLRGVPHSSQKGALVKSIWNTRAWTLQEYIASKVIHFYTEDWIPYLNLKLPNHKESPEIITEMEQATGVSARQLMALRPGLTSVREKLCLASSRKTTWVEDAAYSLLGIFSAVGIPAIYGEGEASLGRLLANVLTRSGDVSILAWTGEPSRFNSCLPARITVFNGLATSHLPPPIRESEVEQIVTGLHTPSFDLDVALRLYDRLDELPTPRFAESRMTLPCIAFRLPPLSSYRTSSGRVYRADTTMFGTVEIRTRYELSRLRVLYLVHPWLDTLLEHEDVHGGIFIEDDAVLPSSPDTDDEISDERIHDEEIDDNHLTSSEPESPSLSAPVRIVPVDRETRARRLVARLRQPFGALLLTLTTTGRRATDYRRVAADILVTVQLQENVSLIDILDNVRTLDVL